MNQPEEWKLLFQRSQTLRQGYFRLGPIIMHQHPVSCSHRGGWDDMGDAGTYGSTALPGIMDGIK